jgi:hypothetical protein
VLSFSPGAEKLRATTALVFLWGAAFSAALYKIFFFN